jgi:rhodanese-related sulfurtransferase
LKLTDIFNRVDLVSPDEAKQLLSDNKDAILLDVREPREYEEEHLPGAVLMPMSDIPDKMKELDPSRTIVTY